MLGEIFFSVYDSKIIYIFAARKFSSLFIADVMKLVDMPDLGSGASRRVGSSPPIRTY